MCVIIYMINYVILDIIVNCVKLYELSFSMLFFKNSDLLSKYLDF